MTNTSRYRALIIHDPAFDAGDLAELSQAAGCDAQTAAAESDIAEAAAVSRADLVLIDMDRAGDRAFAACSRLRDDPATGIIPVILITSTGGPEIKSKALDAGADDFFTRPLNTQMFNSSLLSLIRRKRSQEKLKERMCGFTPAVADEEGVIEARPTVMVLGSGDELSRVAAMLEAAACDTALAPDFSGAWERMRDETPDLILSALPLDEGGWDIIARLKSGPLLEEVPLIIISSVTDPDVRARAISMGADDFLASPVNLVEALSRVRASIRKRRINKKLRAGMEALFRQATEDPLTGLYNRQYLMPVIERSLATLRRYRRSFSLFMLDLDDFKAINDRHGHTTGDRVLKEVGEALRESLRASDLAARYGGEEFVVLMPDTGIEGAETIAERMRRAVKERVFKNAGAVRLTASIGVTEFRAEDERPEAVIKRADDALYAAKKEGKNRVRRL